MTSTTSTNSSGFRLQAKKLFLTFPQCEVTKEQAQERLTSEYGDQLLWYIIASEQHQDGTPHLHLALEFKEKFSTRRLDVFDFVGGKHGNYQAMRSQRSCVQYVCKDGNFISNGIDVKAILDKKSGKFGSVAKMVMEGKNLDDINQEDPGFVLQHKRKLEEYIVWTNKRHEKKKLKDWEEIPEGDLRDMDDQDQKIAVWLNNNIRKERVFKQKQLYIHGPPNTGKSSLIQKLSQYLTIYYIPRDEEFYDDYEDGVYDLAVLDEMTHTKTMQWLNQFLDGQSCYLRKKGGQILKKQNLPVLLLSNYSLEQNYKKLYEAGKLAPLMERLEQVEVKEFISVIGE